MFSDSVETGKGVGVTLTRRLLSAQLEALIAQGYSMLGQ
jgi:hypothetical protein